MNKVQSLAFVERGYSRWKEMVYGKIFLVYVTEVTRGLVE